jgi:ferredoxin
MVDFAKYFLSFLQDESCGKCVPCRVGIGRMREILEDFCEGRGTMAQFAVLEDLAWTVQNTSLCALGKTAPNPVLSTLRYFRDEYLAHVEERRCPAGVCKALIRYEIDDALCVRCGECVSVCPHGAIREDDGYAIDDAACQKCGICEDACAPEAIRRIRGLVHA